ncbi:protein Spindly-like [Stylophora pistillata]|uniref:Protein Spindly-B n=1 Tax=Stylophora pistillata TaxID=50429 RepID=A0A2B4SY42_STYPI|nr:protein Spindly-like [Stylophora pistillata]PFX34226.1 Protein Spindly-B [Stylophora pistillata]
MDNEIYFLKEEIIRLKEENEHLQQDGQLAGEIGKNLLENNHELERKLEEVNNDYLTTLGNLEELKQENYSLRSKLETEVRTNSNHGHELDDLKIKLQKEFEAKEKSQQITTEKKIGELRKEIESLQNDINKHTLVEIQLQEKIKKQDEMLQAARRSSEELQHNGRSRLESIEEYIHLASELTEVRDALTMKLADLKDSQERILFDRNVLKERVEHLEEELQEKARQGQTWFNCLQEARSEAGEIKAELESLKADNARRNFGKQGNSLFGEVEDQRLELEKKYGSLRARHEGMMKVHNMTKQHLQRLKNQVATLLQVKSCHADASQIQRLTQALVQKEGEVKMLNTKISSLEKEKEESNISSRLMEFHDAFSEFGDKKDYVNFLQLQLEDSKKALAALNKELQTKTLLQLSETDRLRHTQHQLHVSESNVERLNGENIKLRLKIDDMRIKLQNHSQKDPQNISETSNSSGLRKTKSAIVLSGAKSTSTRPTVPIKKGQENTVSFKTKVAKQEPSIVKPPVVLVKTPHPSSDKEQDSDMTSTFQAEYTAENWLSSNVPWKLPLSTKGVENEAKTKVEFQRKPKVRFQTATDDIDLSETQSMDDNAPACGELLKENSQPEVSGSEQMSSITVKGQKTAPVVINVKKGETKNQCPQQ